MKRHQMVKQIDQIDMEEQRMNAAESSELLQNKTDTFAEKMQQKMTEK